MLAAEGADASILAGGQTLVPMLSMRMARPRVVLDIMRLPGLDRIEIATERSASAPPCAKRALERHAELGPASRCLAAALPWVGHAQTRSRGTVCGSVANADPSAELPLVLVALGGEIELRSRRRSRRVAAEDVLHRHHVDRSQGRRTDRSGALSHRARRHRLCVPRDRAAARRFCHRRLRGGGGCAQSPACGRRRGRPPNRARRCRCRAIADFDDALDAFAWDLDARDDLHATADYRRAAGPPARTANACRRPPHAAPDAPVRRIASASRSTAAPFPGRPSRACC